MNNSKTVNILLSVSTLLLGIIFIVISGKYTNDSRGLWADLLYTIGVLIFVTISFQFIFTFFIKKTENKELEIFLKHTLSNELNGKRVPVFLKKEESQAFPSFVQEARKNLLACGTSLINISRNLEYIESKMKSNNNFEVTFIMMNPGANSSYIDKYIQATGESEFKIHLAEAYISFIKLKIKYPVNVHIYLYNNFPFYSCLFADNGEVLSKMTVTYYLHGLYPPQCPGMILSSDKEVENDFIKLHQKSLNNLISNSKIANFQKHTFSDYWTSRVDSYDNLNWVENNKLVEEIKSTANLNLGDEVLEIGSGTGTLASRFSSLVKFYIGIDICPDMVLRSNSKKIVKSLFLHADAKELPFENDRFDVVLARMVLHHIVDDPIKALKECYRVLKSGGKLIVCEGVASSTVLEEFYEKVFRIKETRIVFTQNILNSQLTEAGFSNITEKSCIIRDNLNNWLKNSGLNDEKQRKIKKHYETAPQQIKDAYNLEKHGDDYSFDAKYIILVCETKK